MLGLTGAIGSGKSTVATMLAAQHGATVIDTDEIARLVVAPDGAAYAAVVERFGESMLAEDGQIDRARLADVVFTDPAALADLNAIVHPAVEAETRARLAAEDAAGTALVVLEVPLLVEAGWDRLVSAVVVVDCPDSLAVERLVRARGMPAEEARRRLAAQAGRAKRLARADVIITNDGSLEELGRQVAALGLTQLRSRPAAPPPAAPGAA